MDDKEGLRDLKSVLEIVGRHLGATRKRYNYDGIKTEDTNYLTMYGSLDVLSGAISRLSDRELRYGEVQAIIERSCHVYFPILPESNERQIPLLMPVIEIEPHKTHFMVRAFEYQEMLKKRHRNCVKTCVVLLHVAPFKQKDLRLWWVRNMVLPTWHNQVWEKNAEEQRGSSSLEGAKDCN